MCGVTEWEQEFGGRQSSSLPCQVGDGGIPIPLDSKAVAFLTSSRHTLLGLLVCGHVLTTVCSCFAATADVWTLPVLKLTGPSLGVLAFLAKEVGNTYTHTYIHTFFIRFSPNWTHFLAFFYPQNLELIKDLKLSKLEGTLVQLPQFTSKTARGLEKL